MRLISQTGQKFKREHCPAMLQQRSSAASNMQKQSACAGHWQQQHHCQLCATTLAMETQKELVRLQLPARHVQAAAAATAVWLARRLTGSDTKVRAGAWLLLVWHVYKSQHLKLAATAYAMLC
jgi:hypothetical protein